MPVGLGWNGGRCEQMHRGTPVMDVATTTHHVVGVLEGADGAVVLLVHARHAPQAHALQVRGALTQHAAVQRVEEAGGLPKRRHGGVPGLQEEAEVVVAHLELLQQQQQPVQVIVVVTSD